MKLRHTGEIRRRAKKGIFPWVTIIAVAVVAFGAYWLYQNPPKLPSFNVRIPDIDIPFVDDTQKRMVILFIPGLDEALLEMWRDDLPHLQNLAGNGIWKDVEPVNPAIPTYSWSIWATGNASYINLDENNTNIPLQTPLHSSINIPSSLSALPVDDASCFWTVLEDNRVSTIVLDTFGGGDSPKPFDAFQQETKMRSQEILSVLNKGEDQCVIAVWHTFLHAVHFYQPALDEEHPFYDIERAPGQLNRVYEMIQQLDALVQNIQEATQETETQIILLSDRGFPLAKYQVNVNTWLWKNGYLQFKEGFDVQNLAELSRSDYWDAIDWQETQVYSLGMGNLYIKPGENEQPSNARDMEGVKLTLQESLRQWQDHRWETMHEPVVSHMKAVDSGLESGPVFRIVFQPNYTVSKPSSIGVMEAETNFIRDINPRHEIMTQSAKHGVFITGFDLEVSDPFTVAGMAPVVLDYFEVEIPAYMASKELYPNVAANTVSYTTSNK